MLKLYVCFFTLLFVGKIFASNINLSLPENLPDEVENNIKAYLGELPDNPQSRVSFIYSAKNNTIKALQALGYYRAVVNTNLTKSEDDTPWKLAFTIQLKEVTLVNSIQVNIIGEAQNDKIFNSLTSNLAIKPQDRLHHGNYQKIKSEIITLALQRGYFDGFFETAQIAITPENTADISLTYKSGKRYKFGKIEFINNTVDQNFINKLVPFTYGDDYQVSILQQFQNNLEKTQYFSNIVIVPNQDDPSAAKDKLVPIQVTLKEAKKHYFDIGLGYATDTEFRISGGWRTPLVNKYGHRQETQIKYSKINPTGRFIYSIPIDGSLNNTIQFKLLLENNEYGDVDSNYWSSRISKIKVSDTVNSEYYIRFLHEEWDIDTVDDMADYFLLGYSWSNTRRDGSLIDPSDGFSQYYNIEATHTDISSETSFLKFYAHWRYIKTIKPKHRIVTRAEIGYTLLDSSNAEELSPSLRFFAGGDQSIRGFAYQSIGPTRQQINSEPGEDLVVGGNRLAVASIEYQYYFTPTIRGAIFADVGSSFDTGFQKKYSVGPGIHYISPIGAIKLDVGYSLSEENPSWRLHLNLGAEL
ncbi:autotransporter assembly complex family protein [Colwellia sp. UCD-KL20]|uniref:autotransporter assembly complex protein TamA n=1 Tax=Colwellia sp. UCD-KL20 TaxID=1917165 RepID=UPI0009713F4A|nr:autotransporter assembly complex family protein [Colwellia sp. UCD-KL20]